MLQLLLRVQRIPIRTLNEIKIQKIRAKKIPIRALNLSSYLPSVNSAYPKRYLIRLFLKKGRAVGENE